MSTGIETSVTLNIYDYTFLPLGFFVGGEMSSLAFRLPFATEVAASSATLRVAARTPALLRSGNLSSTSTSISSGVTVSADGPGFLDDAAILREAATRLNMVSSLPPDTATIFFITQAMSSMRSEMRGSSNGQRGGSHESPRITRNMPFAPPRHNVSQESAGPVRNIGNVSSDLRHAGCSSNHQEMNDAAYAVARDRVSNFAPLS